MKCILPDVNTANCQSPRGNQSSRRMRKGKGRKMLSLEEKREIRIKLWSTAILLRVWGDHWYQKLENCLKSQRKWGNGDKMPIFIPVISLLVKTPRSQIIPELASLQVKLWVVMTLVGIQQKLRTFCAEKFMGESSWSHPCAHVHMYYFRLSFSGFIDSLLRLTRNV